MFGFFRKLKHIVETYDQDKKSIDSKLTHLENIIKDRTDVHMDIHKNSCNIIVIGKYRDRDYVNSYSLSYRDFKSVVDHLIEISRYTNVGKIDSAWPDMKYVIDDEIKRAYKE